VSKATRTFCPLIVALVALSSLAHAAPKRVTVGIVADGPWDLGHEIRDTFAAEIRALAGKDFDIAFPADKQRMADFRPDSVQRELRALLADPGVDVVVAMGLLAGTAAAREGNLAKPVIAPFVIDAELQGLPRRGASSGKSNFTYLATPWSLAGDLKTFRDIAPFAHATILVERTYLEALPKLRQSVADASAALGVELELVAVGDSVADAIAHIPERTEAVYLTPLVQLDSASFAALVAGLRDRRLPTFSQLGRLDVERGIMAGTRPRSDFQRMGRRLALSIQRVLRGEEAANLPVSLELGHELVLDMATVRAIDYWPTWEVITEAELLHRQAGGGRKLTLGSVMREATLQNFDLAALRADVRVGAAQLRAVRAPLLPQVEISTTGRIIDADTAAASFGGQPELLWTGTASLSQILYSERGWSGLFSERHLQRSRRRQLDAAALDVARDAAVAYLGVLRTTNLERIERENLKVSRSNLELARTRLSLGAGGQAEVYRWQSQIARDRNNLIQASAQRNIAEIELNRVLARPSEDPFELADVGLAEPDLLSSQQELFALFADPRRFRLFREFMVREAAENSPELAGLEAALRANHQSLKSTRRSFFAPTVALQANLTQRFYRGGAGSQNTQFDLPDPFDFSYTQPDGTNWYVGVSMSLPLLAGTERFANVSRAEANVARLRAQLGAAEQRVAQRIASALHNTGAAYAAIRLSRDSAEAAHKNLDLVKTAYGSGAATIIDLIDAQRQALVGDQLATNATYDFLLRYIEVQRAVGRFDTFLDEGQRRDFLRRASEFQRTQR